MLCQGKTIHIQMQNSDYLVKNNLLYWYESVFCTVLPCTTYRLLPCTTYRFCCERNGQRFLHWDDTNRAFDMLDHTVLLQKIECIGFRQSVIKWFQSYVIQIIFCGTRRCIFRCWGSFDYCCFWSISEIHTSTPSKPLQRNPFIQS